MTTLRSSAIYLVVLAWPLPLLSSEPAYHASQLTNTRVNTRTLASHSNFTTRQDGNARELGSGYSIDRRFLGPAPAGPARLPDAARAAGLPRPSRCTSVMYTRALHHDLLSTLANIMD